MCLGEGTSSSRLVLIQAVIQCPDVTSQAGIPPALDRAAAAKLILQPPNPLQREVTFAGETWLVKSTSVTQGPHNNWFSHFRSKRLGRCLRTPASAKLQTRMESGTSAEVISKRPVGYGQYSVIVDSAPVYDRNVVFGAFTYAEGDYLVPELDLLKIGQFGRPAGEQPAKANASDGASDALDDLGADSRTLQDDQCSRRNYRRVAVHG